MLLWLNGAQNIKEAPNENYGREMMELFTLGANRGAYTELDVRAQARSLTGWQNGWTKEGPVDFHYDPAEHADGPKSIFGHWGDFEWQDSCRLCVQHPLHPSFFVSKVWSYFVPTQPDAATFAGLQQLYLDDYQVKPVVEAILLHPDLYEGAQMVKAPVVYTAALLRRIGAGITTTNWAWIGQMAGQQLFYPPNVAGWDYTRWLNTATFLGRWTAAGRPGLAGPPAQSQPSSERSSDRPRRPPRLGACVLAPAPALEGDPHAPAPIRYGERSLTARPTGKSRPTRCWSRTPSAS